MRRQTRPARACTRRQFVVGVGVWLPVLGAAAPAQGEPLLKASDSEAQSMAYFEDAAQVPAAKFPNFKPGQHCANCALYAGDAGAPSGPCALFLDKDVAAVGWCKAWELKN